MKLFVFGCSFTRYHWPTWADILSQQYDVFENWAVPGAGNHFIFNSVVECNRRHAFNEDDTVIVMWTTSTREDRYVDNQWLVSGNVNDFRVYDREWVSRFADQKGFLVRDLAFISAVNNMLDKVGCKKYVTCLDTLDYEPDVSQVYKVDLDCLLPDVFSTVFNRDWYSRPGWIDWENCQQNYNKYKGKHWPGSWQEMLDIFYYKTVTNNLSKKTNSEILEDLDYRRNLVRCDLHPLPGEHLLYLDRAGLGERITKTTRKWISECDQWLKDSATYNKPLPNWKPARRPTRL